MEFGIGGISDRGSVRAANEDNFLVAQISDQSQGSETAIAEGSANDCQFCVGNAPQPRSAWLLVVADGIGGHDNGHIASQLVTDHFARFAEEKADVVLAACQKASLMRRLLTNELRKCHQRLKDESGRRRESRKMGSTATIAIIAGAQLFVAHVGDSRCCILSQGRLRQVTRDHTMAQYLLDRGALSSSQAASSPYNHLLYNSLGADQPHVDVEFRNVELQQDDSVLVCSDGLTNPLSNKQLESVMKSNPNADDACRKLVEIANVAGGQDNITCVVAKPLPTLKAPSKYGLGTLLKRVMSHAATFM